ncbi:FAD-dependent oxidoreductase [Microcella sp.]|uniref:FAD-dependent oxidoreductase n=1 Tax=Microcella sp. TaxID=1913979 RepID=UPI00256236DF|nr:FAD-dependent oxidoreductase [Microcella sp.]MBX9472832.1 FAD-dependent monooxygenase [Microcella sp.]
MVTSVDNSDGITLDTLVIGAGPVGLAAALFLADRGRTVRIIDKRLEPSPHSKAFGVNARTLELLAASGVTDAFLQNGRRLERISLHRHDEILATLNLSEVEHAFPFLCVQGQAHSERLLTDALRARSIAIERGLELTSLVNESEGVTATVSTGAVDTTIRARTVFAADGASSTARDLLGIDFTGISYPEKWRLYDVELAGPLDADDAHIMLLDDGGMFVVRHEDTMWRVLGSGRDLLGSLPAGTTVGSIHWESEFEIANRVATRFSDGEIYLGGDAAHVHAGIGARGMNLGIEDAFVFARMLDEGRLHEYDATRSAVVKKVVAQITHMMMVPRSTTIPGRLARTFPGIIRTMVPRLRHRVQPWLLGLDHSIDE